MPTTTTDRLSGISTSVAIKPPCRVATISNLPLFGLLTHNGVTLAEGDRVLVMSQTAPTENGIRIASAGGWVRATDFDGARDVVQGTIVLVRPASDETLFYEVTTPNPVLVGTSDITFAAADPGMLAVRDDIEDATVATKGAGMVGFLYSLAYGAGTVGKWLKDLATATGATFIGWKSAATGSVLRTLFARLGDRLSVLDFGADPTGVANSAAAIQAAIDAGKRVYIPNGDYNIGTTGIQITDNTVLDFESRAARLFGTVAGSMISGKDNGTTRRYDALIFSGTLDNTNRATAGGIGIDFKSMTKGKVFGTEILNVETGVRNIGVNPLLGSFYNEYHAVDISGVVTGYENGTLGNDCKVIGGRVNDSVTGTRDNDCSGNLYLGCAIESFTGSGHLNADTTATTNIKYHFSRLENVPTSGVGIDIRALAQVCSYFAPQFVGLTTNISDASASKDTYGLSDDGLVLKSGTPIKKHLRVLVTKDIASLAAGSFRQEPFTVPGLATGDSIVFTAPNAWPNLVVGPVLNGGTDLAYLLLYNPTGAAIDAPSLVYTFDIWRH